MKKKEYKNWIDSLQEQLRIEIQGNIDRAKRIEELEKELLALKLNRIPYVFPEVIVNKVNYIPSRQYPIENTTATPIPPSPITVS
jgi:hypothetical protein